MSKPAIRCMHEPKYKGLDDACEECVEESAELTEVSTKCLTLEGVAFKLEKRAAELWIKHDPDRSYDPKSAIAEELREIARGIRKEAEQLKDKQKEILKRDEENRERMARANEGKEMMRRIRISDSKRA
jgi:hypothetical protein